MIKVFFYLKSQSVNEMNANPAGIAIAYIHAMTFTTGVHFL
jgi:hypothetical protein